MKILLIHGLGRSPLSMMSMASALQKAGHTTESFGYAATLKSFDEITLSLRDRLQKLSHHSPYGIVTHSMGGILTRAALANADFPPPTHVVMLAPPNQSPWAARFANRLIPFRWFSGQSGRNLASADFYKQLPALDCPYTLIAGTAGPTGAFSPFGSEPNDLIVAVSEVRMRSQDPLIQLPVLHSFLMNNPQVQQTTIQAFANPSTSLKDSK